LRPGASQEEFCIRPRENAHIGQIRAYTHDGHQRIRASHVPNCEIERSTLSTWPARAHGSFDFPGEYRVPNLDDDFSLSLGEIARHLLENDLCARSYIFPDGNCELPVPYRFPSLLLVHHHVYSSDQIGQARCPHLFERGEVPGPAFEGR